MNIIRAYELKVNDIFVKQGKEYLVYRISDKIYYKLLGHNKNGVPMGGGYTYEIGLRSQERLEILTSKRVVKYCPVIQMDEQGYVLSTYSTLRSAYEVTGVKIKWISNCLKGNQKTAGGYKWKRA